MEKNELMCPHLTSAYMQAKEAWEGIENTYIRCIGTRCGMYNHCKGMLEPIIVDSGSPLEITTPD